MGVLSLTYRLEVDEVEEDDSLLKKAWTSMRYVVEEAARRVLMGLPHIKHGPAMRLIMTLREHERLMLYDYEEAHLQLWSTLTQRALEAMIAGVRDRSTSCMRNPSWATTLPAALGSMAAEFLSLRNVMDFADADRVIGLWHLTEADACIWMEEVENEVSH